MQLDTMFSMRMSSNEREELARIAAEERRKDGDMLRLILADYIARREQRRQIWKTTKNT